jgi:hypothetical protein
VLHVQDLDFMSTCKTFVECLRTVNTWSNAHPGHVPMMIDVEMKDATEDVTPATFDALDAEIRSVLTPDDLITPDRQAIIGEAHPELIFRKLGNPLRLQGKKSALGRDQRIKLLADRGFVKLSKWLTQRYGTGIGRDDLIDACACAVAARDSTSCLGGDEVDIRGLRMEINY